MFAKNSALRHIPICKNIVNKAKPLCEINENTKYNKIIIILKLIKNI